MRETVLTFSSPSSLPLSHQLLTFGKFQPTLIINKNLSQFPKKVRLVDHNLPISSVLITFVPINQYQTSNTKTVRT